MQTHVLAGHEATPLGEIQQGSFQGGNRRQDGFFFIQFVLGAKGMPRRYYNYLDQFQPMHAFSTFGSWILGVGFLVTAYTLLGALKWGKKASANPWGGTTLEWHTSSPPPLENFTYEPRVSGGPYDRGTAASH